MAGRLARSIPFALTFTAFFFSTAVHAVPFTTDISVASRNWFDTGFASAFLTAPATQTGAISLTSGGVTTSSPYSGASIVGANPLTGTPTDIGDGLALNGTASTTDPGQFAIGVGSPTDPLQTFLDFTNNSATTTYHIVLAISLLNQVDATGTNAYSQSEFSLSQGATEFFFSDLWSDTVNGNQSNGAPAPGFGGPLSDSQSQSYGFDLAPGATTHISGYWTLQGGAFDARDTASNTLDASVTIAGVRPVGGPPPALPLPGTLALLVPGLLGLAFARGRRRS